MTNFSLQLALIAACCTALLFSSESKAQSANQLYICDNGSGSTNIVSAAQRSGKCKPYQKGMFGNYNAGATVMPLDKATENFTDKAESSNLFANVIAAEKQQAAASANPASVPLEDFKETGAIHIFYCPDYRSGRMIEATSPPEPTCRSTRPARHRADTQNYRRTADCADQKRQRCYCRHRLAADRYLQML